MELLQAYLPEDRRASLAQGIPLPEWTRGTVLFADISGFTPLTEEVTRTLGIRRGTEELTRQLNRIYDAILAPVEQYGGTVITFSGDAVLCFFADTVTADGRWWTDDGGQDDGGQDDPAPTSAVGGLSCALAMQTAMRQFDAVPLPDGNTAHITLKVALATGPVRRMVVGDPTIRRIDTLAGATVTRVARGEEICSHDEIWIDTATAEELGEQVEILEWREEETTHERFGRVGSFSASVEPIENFSNVELTPEQLKQWLHPIVYDWIADQEGEFLTELRPVVALFTRFTGFDFDRDAEVGEKFDRFIVRVQQILAYYHGALLELTIGDKGSYFYAAFGAPIVHEDDAPRAVHAALDLVALCEEVGLKQPPQIGISQGTMRVGAYGSTTRRTYGAQGDEVNLAARLMMHAEAGQVLVSGRISSAVANEFDLEPLPPIRLKGKAEPLLPFVVKGPRTNRPHEPHYALPMIGRERELGQIQDLLERVRHGEGQIVGVTAPAGMGKSRLIGEVVLNARRRGDATWIGESQSFGSNTSYLVWVSIWRAFFDVNPQMPTRRLLRALEGELQDRAPERVDLLPLLGAALQLALPENEFTAALEPEFRKSALQALLVECVRSAAEEAREQNRVLLFVLEDVHWIDPASLDLLARLAGSIAALPVLILLSYRPQEPDSVGAIRDSRRRDESPLRDALPNFTEIVLNELSLEQGEALIRAKLAQFAPETTAPVPAPLIAQITQRAQGNPFYIEELLNYMHDRGLNLRDSAAYTHADLPNSLYRLILSRIDHLAEHQQLTLKVASILGHLSARASRRLLPPSWRCSHSPHRIDALDPD
ncbi:MAG TPA: adenylate/guanylate cyclase domain-containing protein [Anaerolineae bacterium]|nr:adenylate/guanylate cyclase domain-containing protein [Anaerolineae bacterium]